MGNDLENPSVPSVPSTGTSVEASKTLGDSSVGAKEFLYNKTRETQEQNIELQQRIEALERKIESSFIRLDKVENFINKVGMVFGNFFRKGGLNIGAENKAINMETTEQGYLEQRNEPLVDYDSYANSLRAQGLTEKEVNERINSIKQSTNFEGEINKLPENKIPDRGEISYEQYLSERPTFQDFQKETIARSNGNIREAAKTVSQTRERVQADDTDSQVIKQQPNIVDEFSQNISQAFRPQGVNISPENQIYKPEFKTPGELVDAKATDKESAHQMVDLYFGNGNKGERENSQS